MSYKLYQVAVLEIPKKVKDEEEHPPVLLYQPECVIAKDDQSAALKVVQKLGTGLDMDRVEVIVRPF